MDSISRPQLAVYAAAAIAIALVGARYLRERSPGPPAPRPPVAGQRVTVARAGGGRTTVHVAGAVRRPGVYRLPAGARLEDAVRRAGGPTRRADLTAVNLAAKAEDGRQVVVPVRGPPAEAAPAGTGAPTTAAGGAGGAGAGPVNLNTATAEQLDALQGVGPATARQILAYRQEHGGFGSVDELDQVPGIGAKRMEALRDAVRV